VNKGPDASPASAQSGGDEEASPGAPADVEREEALRRVHELLLQSGVSEQEIRDAEDDDVIDLLAVDKMMMPPGGRYTQREVAEITGLPVDLIRRFWRALGFLDMTEDEATLTDFDIEAARLFQAILATGLIDVETAVHLARVIGSSMARVADAQMSPRLPGSESDDPVIAADGFTRLFIPALPALSRLLEFVWRRHLLAAARRAMLLRVRGHMAGTSPVLAVGFADMVGFTLLSQHLTAQELADVVRRFEEVSHDIVTELGGQAVKMIGDEVMFVVDGALSAARIGLSLAAAYAADELLSDVRVGLAVGSVVARDGDFFGPIVNTAHRIVNIANPGTVVVSDEFWATLCAQAPDEFEGVALRPRVLKDLGHVQLWQIARSGEVAAGSREEPQPPRDGRWDRLASVRSELEELAATPGEGSTPAGE
jgi:adenylate cyclase